MPHDASSTRLAVRAAELVAEGRAATVAEAIRLTCELFKVGPDQAPRPGRVRQHLQAMSMQKLGAAGYAAMTRGRLELAEAVMTILAERPDALDVLLAGRAAAGNLDGDITLHVRVYTRRRIGDLAEDLVAVGFEEPRFTTVSTRFGRLDRLEFRDGDATVKVTRCLPEMHAQADRDLCSGRRLPLARLPALRAALAASADDAATRFPP